MSQGLKKAKKGHRAKRPIRAFLDFAEAVKRIANFHSIPMEEALDRFAGPAIRKEDTRIGRELYGHDQGANGAG